MCPTLLGRTGRFGRKGISINFVHDKKTWNQMEAIEKSIGRKIIRIETNDLDAMEEVRLNLSPEQGVRQSLYTENEKGSQVNRSRVSRTVRNNNSRL